MHTRRLREAGRQQRQAERERAGASISSFLQRAASVLNSLIKAPASTYLICHTPHGTMDALNVCPRCHVSMCSDAACVRCVRSGAYTEAATHLLWALAGGTLNPAVLVGGC